MPIITVNMTTDGYKNVEISNTEMEILDKLEERFGSIHDAINKLPEKESGFKQLCIEIMNRQPALKSIKSYIFYM